MPPKTRRGGSTPRAATPKSPSPPQNNPSSAELIGEPPNVTASPLTNFDSDIPLNDSPIAEPQIAPAPENDAAASADEVKNVSDAEIKGEGTSRNDVIVGSEKAGKAKKIVKRTVKVVRKVIKKVPKKSLKSPIDTNNLVELVNNDNINDVVDSIEVSNSVGVKAEEVKQRELMDVGSENVENSSDEAPVKFDEGVNVGGTKVGNDEDGAEEGRDDECRNENKEGEGKLFGGEWEVMERRKRRKTQIFIGGLSKDANEEDVRKVFGEVGEIMDLRVVMNDKTGKNKGFAFVRYSNADEAKKALDKLFSVEICGKECTVKPVEGNDTIFLGNIDKKWKDQDVIKLLHDAGIENIDKATAMIDPTNIERNRGFAFVEFETIKHAQVAYRKLQKENIFGKNKKIKVAWAEPLKELGEDEKRKVKTVFAEFMPLSWDEKKVRDAFEKFGEIEDIILGHNLRTTKRKDIAFISYKTREAAIECIESCSREFKDVDGTKVNIKVSFAKSNAKTKTPKPAAKPVAREAAKVKTKANHSNARMIEPRNMVQPAIPYHGIQMSEGSSTNVELIRLLREQASWMAPHARPCNSSSELQYATPLSGIKRQYSALEADPPYADMHLYPHRQLDASFPLASSSRSVVPHNGLTSSLTYHQHHSAYPSGAVYGARNYPTDIQIRENERRSGDVYRRY